jgi:hypothetical protein
MRNENGIQNKIFRKAELQNLLNELGKKLLLRFDHENEWIKQE